VNPQTLAIASQATQAVAISILLFEGVAYNWTFLWRILPAVGKEMYITLFTIVFNVVWGLATWSYFAAHTADPGAVPKRWQEFVRSIGDTLPIAPARPEWQPGKATFCKKCDVARPERAHHCLICDVCVLRMDHHCPWINNCVGFNNHKFFLLLGIYACLASFLAVATSLPELVYVMGAVLHIVDDFPWGNSFVREDGFISSRGETILELTTTLEEAKRNCATLDGCIGFTFLGGNLTEDGARAHMYFKDDWDLAEPGSGWVSYRLAQTKKLEVYDVVVFLIFGFFAICVAMLLTPMLVTHLPLATQNLTTIEDNYENMPNPFDQGSSSANLAQIFGVYGPDWFLPVLPWRPLSDGVSFARSDQRLGPDGLPERPLVEEGMDVENVWRLRYHVRNPVTTAADEHASGRMTSPFNWWWTRT